MKRREVYDNHSCDHFHVCPNKCDYYPYTNNCNEKCSLEYGHKGRHNCDATIHYCKGECNLYWKSQKIINKIVLFIILMMLVICIYKYIFLI